MAVRVLASQLWVPARTLAKEMGWGLGWWWGSGPKLAMRSAKKKLPPPAPFQMTVMVCTPGSRQHTRAHTHAHTHARCPN
eukprot:1154551-Pelagomonas_calceolata.AAC.2